MNTLKVTFLMLALMLLFSYLGFYFGGQNGMIMAFLIAAGMNFFTYWFSDKMVLTRVPHSLLCVILFIFISQSYPL